MKNCSPFTNFRENNQLPEEWNIILIWVLEYWTWIWILDRNIPKNIIFHDKIYLNLGIFQKIHDAKKNHRDPTPQHPLHNFKVTGNSKKPNLWFLYSKSKVLAKIEIKEFLIFPGSPISIYVYTLYTFFFYKNA